MSDALITVRFDMAGLHHWPQAPARRAYLAAPHRHLFGVEVAIWVTHDDREVEYHDLLDEARISFIQLGSVDHKAGSVLNFGAASCEVLARRLGHDLSRRFKRTVTVTVSEDRECSAQVMSVAGE